MAQRSQGEEVNVAVSIAIGVDHEANQEVLGMREGVKRDVESVWGFLRNLKGRGLLGVKWFVSDKCLGLIEALSELYPEAAWQRCVVHLYRNAFSVVPNGKVREVAAMLKAIHAQEDKQAARLRHVAGTR